MRSNQVVSPLNAATSFNFSNMKIIKNDNGEVTELKVDGAAILKTQNLTSENFFLKLKDFFANEKTFKSEKEFEIIDENNQLFKKKEICKSWLTNPYFLLYNFVLHNSRNTTKEELSFCQSNKIKSIYNRYQEKNQTNLIFEKTANHNIKQLNDKPKTNSTITKIALVAITAAILAGTIGVGALLPYIGLGSLGIPFVSLAVSIGLISIGAVTITSLAGLVIAAKRSNTIKEYLKDLLLKRSEWFLEANLNDFTNSALFACLGIFNLASISTTWSAILIGCLAYPTGLLLMGSGLYQLVESCKDIVNNYKISDRAELIKAIVNFAFSLTAITMGIITVIGMINAPVGIAITIAVGVLLLVVNTYSLYKSVRQLIELYKVNKNDPKAVYKYLNNKLSLTKADISKLKKEAQKMQKKDILKWIKANLKNFPKESKNYWNNIVEQIQKDEIDLQIVKDMIYNQEAKKVIESKISRFGAIVNKNTLQTALTVLKAYNENPSSQTEKLLNVFAKSKSDTTTKTIAEAVKFAFINMPLMVVPLFLPGINMIAYNLSMGVFLFSNLAINITPRFRNVPPTMLKKPQDINQEIEAKEQENYKEQSNAKNETVTNEIMVAS
jgi:hypothetical protein